MNPPAPIQVQRLFMDSNIRDSMDPKYILITNIEHAVDALLNAVRKQSIPAAPGHMWKLSMVLDPHGDQTAMADPRPENRPLGDTVRLISADGLSRDIANPSPGGFQREVLTHITKHQLFYTPDENIDVSPDDIAIRRYARAETATDGIPCYREVVE